MFILLPLSRGLSLRELGLAAAMQGLVVFALELPTGGLADSVGRRRVLLSAMVISIISIGLFLVRTPSPPSRTSSPCRGVHRALDSGPLEAWYVDTALAADPDTRIDKAMGARGTILGVAIAVGAVASGGLVALDPLPGVDALTVPVVLALGGRCWAC